MGKRISLMLCPRVLGFWVGICTSVMGICGVGNLILNVQCDKGLVFH